MQTHNSAWNYLLSCFKETYVIVEGLMLIIFQILLPFIESSIINRNSLSFNSFKLYALPSVIEIVRRCKYTETFLRYWFLEKFLYLKDSWCVKNMDRFVRCITKIIWINRLSVNAIIPSIWVYVSPVFRFLPITHWNFWKVSYMNLLMTCNTI